MKEVPDMNDLNEQYKNLWIEDGIGSRDRRKQHCALRSHYGQVRAL